MFLCWVVFQPEAEECFFLGQGALPLRVAL